MRTDYQQSVAVQQAMPGMRRSAEDLGLEPALYELVEVRASQLNGCAHRLELHTKDAIALAESHDRHFVAAAAITNWNRLAVGLRANVGSDVSRHAAVHA